MALKNVEGLTKATASKFDLQASNIRDFEAELGKTRILEAAYKHLKLINPSDTAISFGLGFSLEVGR